MQRLASWRRTVRGDQRGCAQRAPVERGQRGLPRSPADCALPLPGATPQHMTESWPDALRCAFGLTLCAGTRSCIIRTSAQTLDWRPCLTPDAHSLAHSPPTPAVLEPTPAVLEPTPAVLERSPRLLCSSPRPLCSSAAHACCARAHACCARAHACIEQIVPPRSSVADPTAIWGHLSMSGVAGSFSSVYWRAASLSPSPTTAVRAPTQASEWDFSLCGMVGSPPPRS